MCMKIVVHTLQSHGGGLRNVSRRLREQGDLRAGLTLLLQSGGRRRRRRSVELLLLYLRRVVEPVGQGRSRNRVSSSLYNRGDSLVLQCRVNRLRGKMRRVTTILAD